MIAEVIRTASVMRSADTKHTIYSLLTAYIETTHVRNTTPYLPEQVTRLPLGGHQEIIDRFSVLTAALDGARQTSKYAQDALTEALGIFGTAVFRLWQLSERPLVKSESFGAPIAETAMECVQ